MLGVRHRWRQTDEGRRPIRERPDDERCPGVRIVWREHGTEDAYGDECEQSEHPDHQRGVTDQPVRLLPRAHATTRMRERAASAATVRTMLPRANAKAS